MAVRSLHVSAVLDYHIPAHVIVRANLLDDAGSGGEHLGTQRPREMSAVG